MHCHHLETIAAIDGEDSEEYRAYALKVIQAQKKMKGNFSFIHWAENVLKFLSASDRKVEAARLTKEGEELINPCTGKKFQF